MRFEDSIRKYIRLHPITSLILGLNTIMVFVVMFGGGFTLFNLVRFGGLVPPLVLEDREYYRIIMAMFLHGSFIHFLVNSYVLFYIGGHLERIVGPNKYGLLYMASGIVASLMVVFFGDPNVVTIGASGAIYGVMGGLFMLTLIKKKWFRPETVTWIRNLILINLVITFLIPNISVLGHLGGLVSGIVLFYFLTPNKPYFVVQYEKEHGIIEANTDA